ncbi:MAG: hypothetical protein GIKADHBN_00239 [Phycisphaerales bacterium]|nr:hypothetical protein [Phycisphaerales bacterium]
MKQHDMYASAIGLGITVLTATPCEAQFAQVRVVQPDFEHGLSGGILPRMDDRGRTLWRRTSIEPWQFHDGTSTSTLLGPKGSDVQSFRWSTGQHLLAYGLSPSGERNTWVLDEGGPWSWTSLDREVSDMSAQGYQVGFQSAEITAWLGEDSFELPQPILGEQRVWGQLRISSVGTAAGVLRQYALPPNARFATWAVNPPVLTELPASPDGWRNFYNQRLFDLNETGQWVGSYVDEADVYRSVFYDPAAGLTDLPLSSFLDGVQMNDLGSVCMLRNSTSQIWNPQTGFVSLWDLLSPEDQERYILRETFDINNRGEVLLYAIDTLLDESQLVIITIPGPSTMALAALAALAGRRRRRVAT